MLFNFLIIAICVCKKNLENRDGVCTGMAILATHESLRVVLLLVVITFLNILEMIYHVTWGFHRRKPIF